MSNAEKKILFVNACVHRETSRTNRLATQLISHFPDHIVEEIILEDSGITPINGTLLSKRDEAIENNDFNDPMFDYCKQFIDADIIVMASPYWEAMFNTFLKTYIENISVTKLAFSYNERGHPVGNAKGRLFYVTTRGGPVSDENDAGWTVIKTIGTMLGCKDIRILSASGLDIVGNNPEIIINDKIRTIDEIIN